MRKWGPLTAICLSTFMLLLDVTIVVVALPDMAHSLQGAQLAIRLMPQFEGHVPWADAAPQIAGGPASYTDEQFAHLLMTGEKPDGTHLRPPMPQFRLNAEDARAVVAYIKTVPRAE